MSLMATDASRVVEMLRAVGEPTRLRVLALLACEELAVVELGRILGQSQPRVSRHLKLLTDAGLVERFPDGAWVFYRLSAGDPARGLLEQILRLVRHDEGVLARDGAELDSVRRERASAATAYFARVAHAWNEIRSLHVDETVVESAILRASGPGPFERLVDLGTGAGRMLTLIGARAGDAVGLDLNQQMLNLARIHTAATETAARCELRHGDIAATGLPDGCADLVIIHQVLHYLVDPCIAIGEAGRLLRDDGRLLIVDFAPHAHEVLRVQHQHRRLGFSDEEIARWAISAGLEAPTAEHLAPTRPEGLTVVIWSTRRARGAMRRAA